MSDTSKNNSPSVPVILAVTALAAVSMMILAQQEQNDVETRRGTFYDQNFLPALEDLRNHPIPEVREAITPVLNDIANRTVVLRPDLRGSAEDIAFMSGSMDGKKTLTINVSAVMWMWSSWEEIGATDDLIAFSLFHEGYHLSHHQLGGTLPMSEWEKGECDAWYATVEETLVPIAQRNPRVAWALANTSRFGAMGLLIHGISGADREHQGWTEFCKEFSRIAQAEDHQGQVTELAH